MLEFIYNYKSPFWYIFIICTKNCLRSKKILKNGRKIHNFRATESFFLHIFGVAQNFWFNGGGLMAQKRGAIAPPPLTRPENGIPVYTILTCLSIVKGGGTDFVQDMTFWPEMEEVWKKSTSFFGGEGVTTNLLERLDIVWGAGIIPKKVHAARTTNWFWRFYQ